MTKPTKSILVAVLILGFVLLIFIGIEVVDQPQENLYPDGTYRGIFADGNEIQVNVQFELKDGVVESTRFRWLRRDEDYNLDAEEEPYRSVIQQYREAFEYLEGKNLQNHLDDLYTPERIVSTEVDGYTAATIRSQKIISAVRDALNRGVYSHN